MDNLKSFEIELSEFRKGSTRVRFLFDLNLIEWKESVRWFKNFTRTFSEKEQIEFLKSVKDIDASQWLSHYPNPEAFENMSAIPTGRPYDIMWRIVIITQDDKEKTYKGKDAFPPGFRKLVQTISKICHQAFRVSD